MTKPRQHPSLPPAGATAGLPTDDGHTGEIVVVRVHPVGTPGLVRYTVTSTGPVELSREQQIRALRDAADSLQGI